MRLKNITIQRGRERVNGKHHQSGGVAFLSAPFVVPGGGGQHSGSTGGKWV